MVSGGCFPVVDPRDGGLTTAKDCNKSGMIDDESGITCQISLLRCQCFEIAYDQEYYDYVRHRLIIVQYRKKTKAASRIIVNHERSEKRVKGYIWRLQVFCKCF